MLRTEGTLAHLTTFHLFSTEKEAPREFQVASLMHDVVHLSDFKVLYLFEFDECFAVDGISSTLLVTV